jgi:DNA-binding transcriptional MerR regulator
MMTIGELASRCGLSPKVLRSYADAGVLVPAVVSFFNDVPQLFVELDEPRLDLRHDLRETVTGCHVGFMMSKRFVDQHGP